ncbi:MAG: hypothetical protein Q8Q59_16015 [Luteolibacter sp.]|nr:hypothetical protein [Luteolibacter sp.]
MEKIDFHLIDGFRRDHRTLTATATTAAATQKTECGECTDRKKLQPGEQIIKKQMFHHEGYGGRIGWGM